MATFLELGIFQHFAGVFTFLLIYVFVFALLEFSKPFGKNKEQKGLHAIIALAFAVLSIMSSSVVRMISFMIPWFLVVFLIVFFILFVLRMFGADEAKIKAAGTDSQVRTWTIIVVIVIIIFGFGAGFGQRSLESSQGVAEDELPPPAEGGSIGDPGSTATDDYSSNVVNTIVNPKVLGLITLLVIAVFAIFMLAD